MTNPEFLARHPEFSSAPVALVTTALADAELSVSDAWSARRAEIVALTAAAALSDHPNGRNARVGVADPKTGTAPQNPYRVALERKFKGFSWARSRM